MNNKENQDSDECGLSEEQRTRISQNFRAAKALLARKRLRYSLNTSSHCSSKDGETLGIESSAVVGGTRRLPITEIPMNTESPQSIKCLNLSAEDSSIYLFPKVQAFRYCCNAVHESEISSSFETPVQKLNHRGFQCNIISSNSDCCLSSTEGRVGVNLFVTPVGKSQSQCNDLNETVASSSGLDDAFEESILSEIDALCEKPATKLERNVSDSTPVKDLCVEKSSQGNSGRAGVPVSNENFNENESNSSGYKKFRADDLGNSDSTLENGMPEEYGKYMKSLNDRQREAACCDISTPLMIVAGPGSGKTSTMVGRVLMLLDQGIEPSHILAMTFTTAAASEMRERIGSVAGKSAAKNLTISTFHSFSLQLCRSHAEKLGRTPDFLIYGHGQQRRAVIEAVRLFEDGKKRSSNGPEKVEDVTGVNSPEYFKDKSKKWLKFVSQAKASGRTPEDSVNIGDHIGAEILRNYNNILKACNALDYHDLICCSVMLLTEFPSVFKDCQESWRAIVIDEFQDTSAMQYGLLRLLSSHKRITIVGDEDQSIFGFNGADISGFDSFRKDFPMHKEVRLNKNYRSTGYIVEAASSLIQNNLKRCQSKDVLTDNSSGSKITIKECSNENSQCAYVVDKILEITSENSSTKSSYGNIAILYRRQVSGKIFQATFRDRKIPFNVHGVAFYRKKVVRAIISMLKTALPACDDSSFRRVFKALLPFEKQEKKKVIEHIDKVATVRKCSFISASSDIFGAKISGTFKRTQLTQGRKVLLTLDMIKKLVHREQSISAVVTSVANMIPQKYILEQRAVVDVDGGKLLNEDNDLRSVLQYLLDDVSDFLTTKCIATEESSPEAAEGKVPTKKGSDDTADIKGCYAILKAFIDHISEREMQNFRSRRHDNEDSVTLTTIHQSKGLEWDVVFIVKVNESEIPLLHECKGILKENGSSVEEERRLLYVAITRARKKLFILYLLADSNWQVLQPSRFLREIPYHLQEINDDFNLQGLKENCLQPPTENPDIATGLPARTGLTTGKEMVNNLVSHIDGQICKELTEPVEACNSNEFLRRFRMEDRAVVSHLFHQWAKMPAFQDPKRLLDKVGFVIDERLRAKKRNNKDVLRSLKSSLRSDEAFHYATSVLKWEQIPAEKRVHLLREKQEHFQKQRIESAMGSSTPTSKQMAYLQTLGCTVTPTSRLHASRLIEQYKSL